MKWSIFIFLFLIHEIVDSQSIYFNKSYDSPNQVENGSSVLQMDDNGYLVASASYDYNNYAIPALYLIRTNKYGDTLWTKSIMKGDVGLETKAMKRVSENRIIVGGTAICCTGVCARFFLALMDTLGDTLWVKTYWPTPYRYAVFSDVIPIDNNEFLAMGFAGITDTCSFLAVGYGELAQVIKIDSSGNIEWQKYFGGDSLTKSNSRSAIETNSGDYIIAGETSINDSWDVTDGYLLRLDNDGNLIWKKIYGSYGILEGFTTIFESSDSGYYFLGGYKWGLNKHAKEWLMKIDGLGNQQWEKFFGRDSLVVSGFIKGMITYDNNIVFIGGEEHNAEPLYGIMTKVSQNGDSLWSYRYRGDTGFYYMSQFYKIDNNMYNFRQTTDSGFVVVGSDHPYTQDVWLLKVDQYGCDSIGCQIQSGVEETNQVVKNFSVYPNPTHDQLFLLSQEPTEIKTSLINSLGEVVKSFSFKNSTSIDVSDLPAGLYFIQFFTEENSVIFYTKILKL